MRSARFHKIRDRVSKAVDKTFAEPVKFFPLNEGESDPDREILEIEAPLRVNSGRAMGPTGGVSGSWNSKIEAGKGELHIDRAVYPELVIRKGDKFQAIARIGEPFFQVEHPNDRGQSRLVIELSEV